MASLSSSYESFPTCSTPFFDGVKAVTTEALVGLVEGVTKAAHAIFSAIKGIYEGFQALDRKLDQLTQPIRDGILEMTRSAFKGSQEKRASSGYESFEDLLRAEVQSIKVGPTNYFSFDDYI